MSLNRRLDHTAPGHLSTNEVLTRDLTSGRIHRRIAVPGGYATLEGDNLDEAGEFEVITTLDNAEKGDLCERCFPPSAAPSDEPV